VKAFGRRDGNWWPATGGYVDKVQEDVFRPWGVVKSQPEISQEQENSIKALYDGVVRSLRKGPTPEMRCYTSHSPFLLSSCARRWPSPRHRPIIGFLYCASTASLSALGNILTTVYPDVLNQIATSGTTFEDKMLFLPVLENAW
jgi:fatty acid synthase subunit alpha